MSLPTAYFRDVFAASDDPWSFRTRWYEARKRALTLAMLPRERFARAFEPGCANGELTAALAPRCDALLATDCAPRAIELAQRRLAAARNVTLRCARFPDDWPDGTFNLIVVSEIAYYFDRPTVDAIAMRMRATLAPEGILVLCHWRHPVADYPLRGDDVHAAFRERVGLPALGAYEDADFLLDAWSVNPASVAAREGLA